MAATQLELSGRFFCLSLYLLSLRSRLYGGSDALYRHLIFGCQFKLQFKLQFKCQANVV